MGIVIREELAQALLTLLRLGTFPVQYAQLREVEVALLNAVEAADVKVEETTAEQATSDLVENFPGGLV